MTTQNSAPGKLQARLHDGHWAYRQLAVEVYVPADTQKFNPHVKDGASPSTLAGKTIRMTGFRCEVDIECYGQLDGVAAQINITNVPPDIMNAVAGYYGQDGLVFQRVNGNDFPEVRLYDVTQYGRKPLARKATNGKSSGDGQGKLIYRGYLTNAIANMGSMPDPFLSIQSNSLLPIQLLKAEVISYRGSVPTITVIKQIADAIGYTLEDSGVNTVMVNPYLTGNYIDQLDKMARYGGDFSYLLEGKTLAVWPNGGYRKRSEESYAKINKGNGMIYSPSFNRSGVTVKTIFRSDLHFGDKIEIESESLPNATGLYAIRAISHHLSSELPEGLWESHIAATFMVDKNTPVAIARHS
ncbi:MAG: hypothetical protein M3036_07310 [Bifidobacteriales bacterium]|nr:hypothetical protein [Bifidobacteriales bacterium]